MNAEQKSFSSYLQRARGYGIGEFLEIIGEMSQESTKKGALDRKTKELVTLGIAIFKRCNRCITIHTADAIKLGASEAELVLVNKIVLFMASSPHGHAVLWATWIDAWREFALARGALTHTTRELIALAIAVVKQHEACIKLHVDNAMEFGATAEQVFEVIPIALLMDGAPTLSQLPQVVDALEQAQKRAEASVDQPCELES